MCGHPSAGSAGPPALRRLHAPCARLAQEHTRHDMTAGTFSCNRFCGWKHARRSPTNLAGNTHYFRLRVAMFEALGLLGARGSFTELLQSCAMVPELKSRAALDNGDYSLKAARIGVPKCTGTGVCSCVLPTPAGKHGQVASLAQVSAPPALRLSAL